jgi:hypothetical protein
MTYYRFSKNAKGFLPAKNGQFVLINGTYIARTCANLTISALPSAGEHLPKPLRAKDAPNGSIYHTGYFGPNGQHTPQMSNEERLEILGPNFAAELAAAKARVNDPKITAAIDRENSAIERKINRENRLAEKAAKSAAYHARVAANKAARDAAKAKRAVERAETIARREQEKAEEAKRLAAAVASAPKPLTANNRKFQEAVLADIRATNAKRYGL